MSNNLECHTLHALTDFHTICFCQLLSINFDSIYPHFLNILDCLSCVRIAFEIVHYFAPHILHAFQLLFSPLVTLLCKYCSIHCCVKPLLLLVTLPVLLNRILVLFTDFIGKPFPLILHGNCFLCELDEFPRLIANMELRGRSRKLVRKMDGNEHIRDCTLF